MFDIMILIACMSFLGGAIGGLGCLAAMYWMRRVLGHWFIIKP